MATPRPTPRLAPVTRAVFIDLTAELAKNVETQALALVVADDESEFLADAIFNRLVDIGILAQELLRVLATLAKSLTGVREPCAALFDDALVDRKIQKVASLGNAFAVHDVEFGFAERWRDFVLHHFHARAAADDLIAVFDRRDATDVEPHRRVELERTAARGCFRVAEHDADLLAQLVDEDQTRLGFRNGASEFPERLRHQPRLKTHGRIAHVSVDFRLRHERGHRVHDDDVDTIRSDEHFDDLERLLTVVRLRDQQVFEIHAELLRINRVERMFGVHECRHAAALLGFRDDLERQRRLARGLRAEDFDDATARHAADAERVVDADGASRN